MFADVLSLLCKAPNTSYSVDVSGTSSKPAACKVQSGVAPCQALRWICLQAGEGDVTGQSKQRSQTLRTSLGYLTFKVNEPAKTGTPVSPSTVILKINCQISVSPVVPASCLPASTQTRSVREKHWAKRPSAASVTAAPGPVLWEATSLSMFAVCV